MVEAKNVYVRYGDNEALKAVNLSIPKGSIYSFIGPSGCGKTTFLRSINRLNDLIPSFSLSGDIFVDGEAVYDIKQQTEVQRLRREIGMIFQRPNPLPMTIMQNMIFPLQEHKHGDKAHMKELAIEKLKMVGLYDEVSHRLDSSALSLSGGQQQRLCIGRALMLESKLMLMDEPCSALDPISTFQIEELLGDLKKNLTIIMVTHNMEQARRISDYTAFFFKGEVIEAGPTLPMFADPQNELTRNYVEGRHADQNDQNIPV